MALGSAPPSSVLRASTVSRPRRVRRRALWALAALTIAALLGLATAAILTWSGASVVRDRLALARVDVQPLGGTLVRARATGPNGRPIPLTVSAGRLTPRVRLTPGERVSVDVVVRRPGWSSWALGSRHHERLVLRAPVARVKERWLTVRTRSGVRVSFDRIVNAVAVRAQGAADAPTARPAPRDPPHRAAQPPARSRSRRQAVLGADRHGGGGQLVSARPPAGRRHQPGAGRAADTARSDPTDVLQAGGGRARRRPPRLRLQQAAAGTRWTATRWSSSPGVSARAWQATCRWCFPSGGAQAPVRAWSPPNTQDRLDGSGRLVPAPGAVARAGRIPARELGAVRVRRGAHAT